MKKVILLVAVWVLLLSSCGTASPSTNQQSSNDQNQGLPASGGDANQPTEIPSGIAETVNYHILPDQSKVSYNVNETLLNQGNVINTAIGTTNQISGTVTVDTQNPLNSSIGLLTVDMSTFKSDQARRDNTIRGRFLESANYPYATFKPTQVSGLPSSYTLGNQISFQVTGDLTIRNITKPASFNVTGTLNTGQISGEATTTIKMSDYGFGPISIAGLLNTQDEVKIIIDFIATP